MKAVIVEIKDGYAAVLSDDGCIVKIKNNDYEIGDVIQMSTPKIRFTKKLAALTATAAAVVFLSAGSWAYASPYTYVSLDVNPSIEFTVNRFDRVLRVKAVNDDGEEIIKEISIDNLKNKTIQDAVTKTVDQISEAGYFDGNTEGGIVITTSGKDSEKADELASELQDSAEQEVTDNGDDVVVEAYSVGLERVEEARELGVTPGKLNLVEKLQDSAKDPSSIDINEWLNKSVRDIMKATKENRMTSEVNDPVIQPAKEDQNSSIDTDQTINEQEKQQVKAQSDKASLKADKAQEKASEKTEKLEQKASDKSVKIQEKASDSAAASNVKAADKSESKTGDTNQKTTGKQNKDTKPAGNVTTKQSDNGQTITGTPDNSKAINKNHDSSAAGAVNNNVKAGNSDNIEKADKAADKTADKALPDNVIENQGNIPQNQSGSTNSNTAETGNNTNAYQGGGSDNSEHGNGNSARDK